MDVARILNHYNYAPAVGPSYAGNVHLVCPFHEDQQASLNINIGKGICYCFGCGWKGDIIDFVGRMENVNRLKAMQKINQISKGTILDRPKVIEGPEKPDRYALRQAYYEYRKGYLPDWRMPTYMTERGLTPELLAEIQVRVDPVSDYPFIIPIRENGKFAGYVRRAIKEESEPKYLYNKGFRRSLILMGHYEPGIILVTEGVFDYLKAHQFGHKNCVSLLGWKASPEQIEKLKSVTSVIITALDNDERGKEGTEFLKEHFNVIEFLFPKGVKDLGEISKSDFLKGIKISKEEFNKCQTKRRV